MAIGLGDRSTLIVGRWRTRITLAWRRSSGALKLSTRALQVLNDIRTFGLPTSPHLLLSASSFPYCASHDSPSDYLCLRRGHLSCVHTTPRVSDGEPQPRRTNGCGAARSPTRDRLPHDRLDVQGSTPRYGSLARASTRRVWTKTAHGTHACRALQRRRARALAVRTVPRTARSARLRRPNSAVLGCNMPWLERRRA